MRYFQSKQFTNKNGKPFRTRSHFAKFDTKHNATRSRVYMVLYWRRFKLKLSTGLTLGQLVDESSVSYKYVKTRIAKWCTWGFLQRRFTVQKGRPVYSYSIGERGIHFIRDVVPKEWLDKYAQMIRDNRKLQ
jgi:predicted ArsR family transcriptional regulator